MSIGLGLFQRAFAAFRAAADRLPFPAYPPSRPSSTACLFFCFSMPNAYASLISASRELREWNGSGD